MSEVSSDDEDSDSQASLDLDVEFYQYLRDTLHNFSPSEEMDDYMDRLDADLAEKVFQKLAGAVKRQDDWTTHVLAPLSLVCFRLQRFFTDSLPEGAIEVEKYIWELWASFLESYDPDVDDTPSEEWCMLLGTYLSTRHPKAMSRREYREEFVSTVMVLCMVLEAQGYGDLSLSMNMALQIAAYDAPSFLNFDPFFPRLCAVQSRHPLVLNVVLSCFPRFRSDLSSELVMKLVKGTTADNIPPASSHELLSQIAGSTSPRTGVCIAHWFLAFKDWSLTSDRAHIDMDSLFELSGHLIGIMLTGTDDTLVASTIKGLAGGNAAMKASWLNLLFHVLDRYTLEESQLERVPDEILPKLISKHDPSASSALQRRHYGKTRDGTLAQIARTLALIDKHAIMIKPVYDTFKSYRGWLKVEDWSEDLLNAPGDEQLILDTFPFLKNLPITLTSSIEVHMKVPSSNWSPPEIIMTSLLAKRAVGKDFPKPTLFSAAVSAICNPESKQYLPPGLYSMLICYHILRQFRYSLSKGELAIFNSKQMKVPLFIQWFESLKTSMQEYALKNVWKTVNAENDLVVLDMSNIIKQVLLERVTIPQAQEIAHSSIPEFVEMFNINAEALILNDAVISGVEKIAKEHLAFLASFTSLLHQIGIIFPSTVLKASDLQSMTMANIRATIEGFQKTMADSGFDEVLTEYLQVFLKPTQLQLFKMAIEKELKGKGGHNLKDLAELVRRTSQRVQLLFSPNVSLASLEELWILASNRGLYFINSELAQLKEFFPKPFDIHSQVLAIEKSRDAHHFRCHLFGPSSPPQWEVTEFSKNFAKAISLLADPKSDKYIPPSLYGAVYCHQLLVALHQYAKDDIIMIFDRISGVAVFFEWFYTCLREISDQSNLIYIHEAITSRLNSFIGDVNVFFISASLERIYVQQARLLASFTDLDPVVKLLGIGDDLHINTEFLNDLERQFKDNLTFLPCLVGWFRRIGINLQVSIVGPRDWDNMMIKDIRSTLAASKRELIAAGFDDHLLNIMREFIFPRPCELLTMAFAEESKGLEGQNLDPKNFTILLQRACAHIQRLLTHGSTSNHRHLWNCIVKMDPPAFHRELGLLQKFLDSSSDFALLPPSPASIPKDTSISGVFSANGLQGADSSDPKTGSNPSLPPDCPFASIDKITLDLGGSKLLTSHSTSLIAVSAVLDRFAQKWREFTKLSGLNRLARSLDLSSHSKEFVASSSQLADDALVLFAEKDGILAKLSSSGCTFLHLALRVGNWNAIRVFVAELESIGKLQASLSLEADGTTPAQLAFDMLSFAIDLGLPEDELWEIVIAGSLLDILVVSCLTNTELKAKTMGLFEKWDSLNPNHRRRFEAWHFRSFGCKYDEGYDFTFP